MILAAEYVSSTYSTKLKVWEGRGHCERISKDSAAYAKMLEGYML